MSKILIIEDEEAIADLEKDYLELSGFEVEIANRGDTGLEKAMKEEYDLIILRWMDLISANRSVRKKTHRSLWSLPKKMTLTRSVVLGLGRMII